MIYTDILADHRVQTMSFYQHVCSHRDGDDLLLFCKSSDGKNITLREPLTPELITSADIGENGTSIVGRDITQYQTRRFLKHTFETARHFFFARKKARLRNVAYDDQLSLTSQWFIQKGLSPCGAFTRRFEPVDESIPLDVMSIDIECVAEGCFPDAEKHPIICISAYSGKSQKVFCLHDTPGFDSFDTERELLHAFLGHVRTEDPDVIVGHNIKAFDNPYIAKRCEINNVAFAWSRIPGYVSTIRTIDTKSNQAGARKRYILDLPGRVVDDTLEAYLGSAKRKSYKLDDIAEDVLGKRKLPMPYEEIPVKFQTHEGRKELAEYCLYDSQLVYELDQRDNIIITLMEMAQVCGCSPLDVRGGQGKRTMELLHRACRPLGVHIPNREGTREKFQGAVVLHPKRGVYTDPVICIDFASLYPTVMISENMCYSTLVTRAQIEKHGWKEGEEVRTIRDYEKENGYLKMVFNPDNVAFLTPKIREGILPTILKHLLGARKRVKKEMKSCYGTQRWKRLNAKQLAYKVCCNSVYGFTAGYMLQDKRISAAVTQHARGLTLQTEDKIKRDYNGRAEVIYGDSVTRDTPLFLMLNGEFVIMPIGDLENIADDHVEDRGKHFYKFTDLKTWSDKGWTKVENVVKHHTKKRVFRIRTGFAYLDVTEDHSLLLPNGTPVKPQDSDGNFKRRKHPAVEKTSPYTYEEAFNMGVAYLTQTPVFSATNTYHDIPMSIVTAGNRVQLGFLQGVFSRCRERDKIRLRVKSKTEWTKLDYIANRQGYFTFAAPDDATWRITVTRKEMKFFTCREMRHSGIDVYDLTTANHHFSVGPGTMIIHNTDSCFVRLGPEICPGTGKEQIENAHAAGELIAKNVTSIFRPPVLMEYECAFNPPFLLFKKKKYVAIQHLPGKPPKLYIKGLECIRRDYIDLLIRTQRRILELITGGDTDSAVELAQNVFRDLHAGRVDVKDIVLCKKLAQRPEDYASKLPHVELARRTGAATGSRVSYLIKAGTGQLWQRAITVEERDKYRLDWKYYADRQFRLPIERIFMLVLGRNVLGRHAVTAPSKRNVGIAKFFKPVKRQKSVRDIFG